MCEDESEKNGASVSDGHRRMVSWKSLVLTKYLAYWMSLFKAQSVRRPGLTRREIATYPNMTSGRA